MKSLHRRNRLHYTTNAQEEDRVEQAQAIDGVPGRYWQILPNGRMQCDVCPRECQLNEGQRGLCFVRARKGEELVLTTYGRSSGFCIDPIEKKPLNHFLPGTPVLSFGTAGCNLTCKFCQNHDISKSRQMDSLMDEAPPDLIAEAAVQMDCRSVAFTYNDPVIFLEYALDTAKACRARGIKSVAVTAAYVKPEAREEFFSHMDATNIDLKGFTDGFYKDLCTADLASVLDTIVYVHHETDVWMELTTLLIQNKNDGDDELKALTDWVVSNVGAEVPIHFSAFHPDYRMKNVPHTPQSTLFRAVEIANQAGIRYAYAGNIHHRTTGTTWCNECGAALIERDWYEITKWALDDHGACLDCCAPCSGVFDGRHGEWGRKRQPVRLADVRGSL